MPRSIAGCQIRIKGIVQGVGFRPHVYRLALEMQLKGWVINSSSGVIIEVDGEPDALQDFVHRLTTEPPPLAVIEDVLITTIPPQGFTDFTIRMSINEDTAAEVIISPDIAVCEDCKREVVDRSDRRYRYPFTNCTNCGPRFTIIKDVPYDRIMTTMDEFPMCPQCQEEYENPLHRRFHAQPNACPICGPKMTLLDHEGMVVDEQPTDVLKMGYILAVKGLGGFHLAVDASNYEAVNRLRRRKQREAKPFAVMARDLKTINKYCQVSEGEARWLTSPQAPIVILTRNDDGKLPDQEIHPGIDTLGVMLPYTPLHFQLFTDELDLLIMTSANISDQPLIIENNEAVSKLAGVADYFLVHNRDIYNPCDDSVIRITREETTQFYRRARGFVPRPVTLPFQLKPVLATGGDMKNTFCLTRDKFAFLSQHGGDLSHYLNYVRFQEAIPRFLKIVNTEPQIIAHDLHPDYQTTKWAQKQELPRLEVQHHHAHMAAAMAENHIEGEVLALICDGTGYGTDGAVWGCEILSGSYCSFTRQGHLRYVPLPGGDTSINRPYRMALVYLWQVLGMEAVEKADYWLPDLKEEERDVILRQVTRGINTLPTSSCGRLFDAVSALLGVCSISQYEGQAAVELEALLDQQALNGYGYQLEQENGIIIMNVKPMWRDIIDDLAAGRPKSEISGKFHAGLVDMFADGITSAAEDGGLNRVILSGGTFYNQYLLTNLKSRLQQAGMQVFYPQHIPTGDGGLSLGQAIIASEVNN